MSQEIPKEEVIIPATSEAWREEGNKRRELEMTGMHPVYNHVAKEILERVEVSEPTSSYDQIYIPKLSRRQLVGNAVGTLGALMTGDIFMNRSKGVKAALDQLPNFSHDRITTEVKDGIRPDAIYQGIVTIYPSDISSIKQLTGEDINFNYDTQTFNDTSIDVSESFTVEGALIVYLTIDHQKIPVIKFSISEGDSGTGDYFKTVGYLKASFLMDEDPLSKSKKKELVKVKTDKDGNVFVYDGAKYIPYKGNIGVVRQPSFNPEDVTPVIDRTSNTQ